MNPSDNLLELVKQYVLTKKRRKIKKINEINSSLNRNIKNIKYVIYARKSSEEQSKQIKSLEDQVKECKNFALNWNLNVVEILQESESAKEPDIRPIFRNMISRIKKGEIDGIIAWHPDRLARNMKEGGEIIDMLDKGQIRDLKFCTASFENSTQGKMMLGIMFVMAKHYSDNLSENIRRGIRNRLEEGVWLRDPKIGYYKDNNGFLYPDGENFALLKEAWYKRLNGETLENIASFLNSKKIKKATGIGNENHVIVKITSKKLDEIFSDPIYAGFISYGTNFNNLQEIYEFSPMITLEHYAKVNNIFEKIKIKKTVNKALLLRGKIICGLCNNPMGSGISKGKKRYYLYFFCRNCKTIGKGNKERNIYIRAKIIVDFAINFLKKYDFANEKTYLHYKKEYLRVLRERNRQSNEKLSEIKDKIKKFNEGKEKILKLILNSNDDNIKKDLEEKYKINTREIDTLEKEKRNIENLINEKEEILTYEKFVETLKKLPSKLAKVKTLKELDFFLSKIFLKLVVMDDKIVSYRLNPPFDYFIEKGFFTTGGDGGS